VLFHIFVDLIDDLVDFPAIEDAEGGHFFNDVCSVVHWQYLFTTFITVVILRLVN